METAHERRVEAGIHARQLRRGGRQFLYAPRFRLFGQMDGDTSTFSAAGRVEQDLGLHYD